MFKLIIAGSRSFNDYDLLKDKLDRLLSNKDLSTVHIVSGTARGADELGERYAKERGCQLDLFPANWKKYGKSAGFERNTRMARHADAAVVFWDGASRGASHMANTMEGFNKPLRRVLFTPAPTPAQPQQLALGF
jgi:hypothetical protein|tara:strand:+ start:1736 stop:2140 length:405 start_codon:yes stop_codon:yes gene_type:complete